MYLDHATATVVVQIFGAESVGDPRQTPEPTKVVHITCRERLPIWGTGVRAN